MFIVTEYAALNPIMRGNYNNVDCKTLAYTQSLTFKKTPASK